MKKKGLNKKNILIYVVVVLVIIFGVMFLFKNTEEIPAKLILECDKTKESNGFSITLSKKIYTMDDSIKYVEGMFTNIESEFLKGEQLTDYYEYQEALLKEKIADSFGNEYKYVNLVTEVKGKSSNFVIEYIINKNSKEKIEKVLNNNIFDVSIDEIIKKFEMEGFGCKSF